MIFCLGTTSRPLSVARIAAASHTLSTPMCLLTVADGWGTFIRFKSSVTEKSQGRVQAPGRTPGSPASSRLASTLARARRQAWLNPSRDATSCHNPWISSTVVPRLQPTPRPRQGRPDHQPPGKRGQGLPAHPDQALYFRISLLHGEEAERATCRLTGLIQPSGIVDFAPAFRPAGRTADFGQGPDVLHPVAQVGGLLLQAGQPGRVCGRGDHGLPVQNPGDAAGPGRWPRPGDRKAGSPQSGLPGPGPPRPGPGSCLGAGGPAPGPRSRPHRKGYGLDIPGSCRPGPQASRVKRPGLGELRAPSGRKQEQLGSGRARTSREAASAPFRVRA